MPKKAPTCPECLSARHLSGCNSRHTLTTSPGRGHHDQLHLLDEAWPGSVTAQGFAASQWQSGSCRLVLPTTALPRLRRDHPTERGTTGLQKRTGCQAPRWTIGAERGGCTSPAHARRAPLLRVSQGGGSAAGRSGEAPRRRHQSKAGAGRAGLGRGRPAWQPEARGSSTEPDSGSPGRQWRLPRETQHSPGGLSHTQGATNSR